MLSYAGIPLCVPTPEVEGWIDANISTRDILAEFVFQRWPGVRVPWLTYPDHAVPFPTRIKMNSLWWPGSSASRFAVGHFLATDNQIQQIRSTVFGGSIYQSWPLLMSWEDAAAAQPGGIPPTVASIKPNLWMLPARPLSQIPGANGLWMITLVDDRFFWWLADTGTVTCTENTTTWANLYTTLGSALGVTIAADAIPSAYLGPSRLLGVNYEFTPPILDAVAYNCGERIIRNLNGTVTATGPANAKGFTNANLALPAARSKLAGGSFAFSPGNPPTDLPPILPATVRIVYPVPDTGGPAAAPQPFTATLAGLALSDLSGVTGAPFTKTFHDVAVYGSTNSVELQALTNQVATDWYHWNAYATLDIVYDGIVPVAPDGMHDIEWCYRADGVTTRMMPGSWDDPTMELLHASATYGSLLLCCTSGAYVGDGLVCGEQAVDRVEGCEIYSSQGGSLSGQTTKDVSTQSLSTGVNNNVALPPNAAWYITTTGAAIITGLTESTGSAPVNCRRIYLFNSNPLPSAGNAPYTITLLATNAGSATANQIVTPDGSPVIIQPQTGYWLEYSTLVNGGNGGYTIESYLTPSPYAGLGIQGGGSAGNLSTSGGTAGQPLVYLSSNAVGPNTPTTSSAASMTLPQYGYVTRTSGGAMTDTLTTAGSGAGQMAAGTSVTVKNLGGGSDTISTPGGQTINGVATPYVIPPLGEATFTSDGTNYSTSGEAAPATASSPSSGAPTAYAGGVPGSDTTTTSSYVYLINVTATNGLIGGFFSFKNTGANNYTYLITATDSYGNTGTTSGSTLSTINYDLSSLLTSLTPTIVAPIKTLQVQIKGSPATTYRWSYALAGG